jgi:PAT family beta-lactamase induction signal transducer AmpG
VHNSFGAMQDVAIDSLACNTLGEDERGLANGLMFAGAAIGQGVGGAGVLLMTKYVPFQASFVFVAGAISLITAFVVLPMKETVAAEFALAQGVTRTRAAIAEMRVFATQAFRSFIGTSGAFRGVFFALLPAGAMSLGLALQTNLAVESA